MAQIALRKTAQENKANYPDAAEVLTNNVCMDDICESKDTAKEAKKLTEDIDRVLKTGGFNVEGWISNEVLAEKASSEIERAGNVFQRYEEKVLGTMWNFKTDKFHFRIRPDQLNQRRGKIGRGDVQRNTP